MKILCDIGGTYARFAIDDEQGFGEVSKFEAARFDSFEAALEHFTNEQGAGKLPLRIATAAYPDESGRWRFVNNNQWVIDLKALAAQGWTLEIILNDFEAATAGLKNIPDDARETLKAGKENAEHAKCLLGPGTGLGLGYLRDGRVQKTHGGHILATAITTEQAEIIQIVQAMKKTPSAPVFESFVSGGGLYDIYQAACSQGGAEIQAEDAPALFDYLDATEVKTALRLFHEFLGMFAHTAVVTGHAYGGLYLTGGVLDRLIENNLFDFKHFETFFVQNGVTSVREAVNATPIMHITDPALSFRGLQNA